MMKEFRCSDMNRKDKVTHKNAKAHCTDLRLTRLCPPMACPGERGGIDCFAATHHYPKIYTFVSREWT